MDHFLQIPQVGREWEDMPESYTTLGYLAAVTERIRLGTLVTGITYRSLGHVAKLVATLDVLSGGRALCGLGAGWFEREHRLYGWGDLPPLRERFARLEDALELLPLMWGPGAPRFEGRTLTVRRGDLLPAAAAGAACRSSSAGRASAGRCGSSRGTPTRATCSAIPPRSARKLAVLHEHCAAEGRDPAAIEVTHLQAARVIAAGAPRELVGDATVGRARRPLPRARRGRRADRDRRACATTTAPRPSRRFADVIAAFR